MAERGFRFLDRTGLSEESARLSGAVLIKKQMIEEEVARLAALPKPANGRRVSMVVHPGSGDGNGLAPGTAISICVLKPGERTKPIRHNSSLVNFCIGGAGYSVIGDKRIDFQKYDIWTTPPWTVYGHFNETSELQVRFTYSNSPLLEKLKVHVVDENPVRDDTTVEEADSDHEPPPSPLGTFRLTQDGAFLMPYEKLINPDAVSLRPLHWPWAKVKEELDRLKTFGKEYVGRRLYLMYDPATGRTNGTTNSFFATITVRPANIVDRPHKHISAAINYFFAGRGFSVVDGERHTWEAGDLMLSAPCWNVHNHASLDEDVYELTIQDQPMHLALASLLWQESLKEAPKLLGVAAGFATNRVALSQ